MPTAITPSSSDPTLATYRCPIGRLTLAARGGALVGLWVAGQRFFGSPYGIDEAMATEFLPRLAEWADEYGFSVLDYEWADRPDFDDDKQFFDGFHLDTRYGLPQWVDQLFTDIG